MNAELKPLSQQTIVITGASSGHGLATARMAAEQGARVLLIARDAATLAEARDGIRAKGGVAELFAADVSVEAEVEAAARYAIETYGGFDTWVNNAGTGIYATLLDTPIADHRRIFDTNYWGIVHGSLTAARYLKDKPGGGAIINMGSIASDLATPVLSAYAASKHAVKGFTDSLRVELMAEGAPISVTLIKPSTIATPFPEKARNRTGYAGMLPPPLYAPELVAEAILHAAVHQRRSIVVGGAGKLQTLGATIFPELYDQIASRMIPALTDRTRPIGAKDGDLIEPAGPRGQVSGEDAGRRFSLYTAATLRRTTVLGAATAVSLAGAIAGRLLLGMRR